MKYLGRYFITGIIYFYMQRLGMIIANMQQNDYEEFLCIVSKIDIFFKA